MAQTDLPRVAILGAGPLGLEAALYAATLQLPWAVYERGRVGEHLRQWGWVKMFSPFGMNSTPLGRTRVAADHPEHELPEANALLTGREHVAAYLEPLALSLSDGVHEHTAVLHVGRRGCLKADDPADPRRAREPFRLVVADKNGRERAEEADVVLDCTGVYGGPRWLGDGGVSAVGETAARPLIAYGLPDVAGERREHFADKTTLVVGAGHSAATAVCGLAALAEKHPATWVVWLARGAATQPVRRLADDPLRERDQLAVRANRLATRGDGAVEFHARAAVEAVEKAGAGLKVTARVAGKPQTWEVDRVVAAVGGSPDAGLYRELHVPECFVTLAPGGPAGAASKGGPRLPEPHFHVLGAKAHGRRPHFLLRDGFARLREAFASIISDTELRSRFPALARRAVALP
jgi:thioredoxin reductase